LAFNCGLRALNFRGTSLPLFEKLQKWVTRELSFGITRETPQLYKKYSPSKMKGFLNDYGLKCCGMHVKLEALATENLQQTIETCAILQNEYVTLAGAKQCIADKSRIRQLTRLLDKAASVCRPHRVIVGYHAHPFDFKKIDGRFAWELLFDQVKPEVNMQMDVGNCLAGQGDPLAMLKQYPNRTWTLHLKEHQDKTFDTDYYHKIFQLCETNSVTRWYIVEVGGVLGKGFRATKSAIEKLHKLGK
jgi:sugar phosphate isomerase/epimerase